MVDHEILYSLLVLLSALYSVKECPDDCRYHLYNVNLKFINVQDLIVSYGCPRHRHTPQLSTVAEIIRGREALPDIYQHPRRC